MFPPDSRVRNQIILRGLSVAAGCWAILSLLWISGVTRVFDLKLLDLRFRLRGDRPTPEAITIVGVDDATIEAYHAWPLSRDAYALLLTALAEGGARAVGVDLQFQSNQNQDPNLDAILAYVTAEGRAVVQSIGFHSDRRDSTGWGHPADVEAAVLRQGVIAPGVRAPEAREMTIPFDDLCTAANALGHTNVSIDRDGAIRRLPFLIRHGGRLYPALSLRVVGVAGGDSMPPEVRAIPGGVDVLWHGGKRLRIPLDEEGSTSLDFAGDQAAFPRTYSMLQVLQWYRAGDFGSLRNAFGGRIVLVGLTSMREVTEDIGTTPYSTATPLLYVHANAIDNCLRGGFIRSVPGALHVGLLALLAFPLGWLFSALSLPRALAVAGAATLGLAGVDQALFSVYRVDVPPLLVLLLPALAYAAVGSTRHLFLEKRSRQREEEIRQGRIVQQQFLPEALVGQTLSRYRIIEQIGRGGMGVVYRGEDLRLGRVVAVKVLPGGVLADDSARRRFRREARILSRLTHPHTARLYDFDSQDGADFLVIEYVEGQTLAERLQRGPLEEAETLRLGLQIVDALAEAHAKGIVHRDLKPSNVIVTPGGSTKILDFGLARVWQVTGSSASTDSMTQAGVALGTVPYMAPEVLQGRPVDERTDVYGVGMLLYEMATGRRPFADDAPHELFFTILNQEPPEPRVLNRKISAGLERIILRSLEKDPERRPRTSAELLVELNALNGTAGRARTETQP